MLVLLYLAKTFEGGPNKLWWHVILCRGTTMGLLSFILYGVFGKVHIHPQARVMNLPRQTLCNTLSPPGAPCLASRHWSSIVALWTSARPSANVEQQMGPCWMCLLWSQQSVQFTKGWFLVLSLSGNIFTISPLFPILQQLLKKIFLDNILEHAMMCSSDSTL